MNLPAELATFAKRHELVGSRVTCDPAPTDTDQDVLLLIDPEDLHSMVDMMIDEGFELDGSEVDDEFAIDEESAFQSYSYGDLNLIITGSEKFFGRFMAATSVAKRLNLLRKEDRVALFQAVLYGNACA